MVDLIIITPESEKCCFSRFTMIILRYKWRYFMFNCVKIYLNSWYLEHDLQKDYIVQIDGHYQNIDTGYEVEHPDLSRFDVLLSTSSLDKLEIFMLRLFMDKKRSFSDDCLLHYLVGFFKSYSSKLVNAIEEELGFNHVFD